MAEPMLPFGIRYALTYRDCFVAPVEVVELFPHTSSLGVYGVAKFLHVANQLDRLPAVLEAHLWDGDPAGEKKEASVALQGIDFWARMPKLEEHSRKLAHNRQAYPRTAHQHSDADVYLVGSSTIAGLKAFDSAATRAYNILFKPLSSGLMIPRTWQGICIDPVNLKADGPYVVDELPSSAIIIDDIRNSGKTEAMIERAFPGIPFSTLSN